MYLLSRALKGKKTVSFFFSALEKWNFVSLNRLRHYVATFGKTISSFFDPKVLMYWFKTYLKVWHGSFLRLGVSMGPCEPVGFH